MDLISIFQGSFIEASIAKEILDEEGIPSILQSEHGEGFLIKTGGSAFETYHLFVEAQDAEEAARICEGFLREQSDVVE